MLASSGLFFRLFFAMTTPLLLSACGDSSWQHDEFQTGSDSDYDFKIPSHIPKPFVPENNPITQEKVELGRHLF